MKTKKKKQRGWDHEESKAKMSYRLTSTRKEIPVGREFRGKHVASQERALPQENSLHRKPKRREEKNRGICVQTRVKSASAAVRKRCPHMKGESPSCFEKLASRVPGRLGPQDTTLENTRPGPAAPHDRRPERCT